MTSFLTGFMSLFIEGERTKSVNGRLGAIDVIKKYDDLIIDFVIEDKPRRHICVQITFTDKMYDIRKQMKITNVYGVKNWTKEEKIAVAQRCAEIAMLYEKCALYGAERCE